MSSLPRKGNGANCRMAGDIKEKKRIPSRLVSLKMPSSILKQNLSPLSLLAGATPPMVTSMINKQNGMSILRLPKPQKPFQVVKAVVEKSMRKPKRNKKPMAGKRRKRIRSVLGPPTPVQAAQINLREEIVRGGLRQEMKREIVKNPAIKPPPCPCCGGTDVQTLSHLYEVGYSCLDCGEEYGYPTNPNEKNRKL
mmetsp:Transcript_13912/g.21021  ORF Transcript_13912/g.21021 Transcript_13912/m.21021 type:complete len:195 (-) Transcript_13912:239-823(-)